MFIPSRPLRLRQLVLVFRQRQLEGTIDQINASLTHALSTLPGQERECRLRLGNVRAEIRRINEIFNVRATNKLKANQ